MSTAPSISPPTAYPPPDGDDSIPLYPQGGIEPSGHINISRFQISMYVDELEKLKCDHVKIQSERLIEEKKTKYNEKICPVCWENYDKNVYILSCYHKFHTECILESLTKACIRNQKCPMCKSEVKISEWVIMTYICDPDRFINVPNRLPSSPDGESEIYSNRQVIDGSIQLDFDGITIYNQFPNSFFDSYIPYQYDGYDITGEESTVVGFAALDAITDYGGTGMNALLDTTGAESTIVGFAALDAITTGDDIQN